MPTISTSRYNVPPPAHPPLTFCCPPIDLPRQPAVIHHVDPLLSATSTRCYPPRRPTVISHVDPPLSATSTRHYQPHRPAVIRHVDLPLSVHHVDPSLSAMSIRHCPPRRPLNTTIACPLHTLFLPHQPAPPSTSTITVTRT